MWLFTISLVMVTFVPRSIDETMFMDGVTYAAISRNMAEGIGSFWRPFFAHSFWLPYDNGPYFSGHPPLQFGLQALLFRLLGDTPVVENVYNLLILTTHIGLIASIWKRLLPADSPCRSLAWLPILCWYVMMTVRFSLSNNFLDSTMSQFCLAACYAQLRYEKKDEKKNSTWLLVAGLFVFLAILTKGPVGLYPLAFTLLFRFCYSSPNTQTAWKPTAMMVLVVGIGMLFLALYTPSREFMVTYLNGQVVQALLEKRERAAAGWMAHFILLRELAVNILPNLIGLALVYGLAFALRLLPHYRHETNRVARLAALVAFSIIAPMLISVKQYHHYLLPALPFVAIFFAALTAGFVAQLATLRRALTVSLLIAGIIACWGVTLRKVSQIRPDTWVSNARILQKLVPAGFTIGICPDLYHLADIHANLQRRHRLSLTRQTGTVRFVLADSTCLASFGTSVTRVIPLNGGFLLIDRISTGSKLLLRRREGVSIVRHYQ